MERVKKLRFVGLIVVLLFLHTTLSSDTNKVCATISDNTCDAPEKKIYLSLANVFNNYASFDYNSCADSWIINSYPPTFMNWSDLGNLDYWFIISVTSCDNTWNRHQRYCLPAQTFKKISGPPTGTYAILGDFVPDINWNFLGVDVPSDRASEITIYVYSRCDVCNLSSASLHRYGWDASIVYLPSDGDYVAIGNPLYATLVETCTANCQ